MKSIESEELIVLIVLTGSNQVNKKFITRGLFRHYFSSRNIEEPRTKLSIYLVVY